MTSIAFAAAITLVFTQGSLFDGLRARGPATWRYLWGCPLCLGWWVGVAIWAASGANPGLFDHLPAPWALVFGAGAHGALTGVVALTLRRIWDALEAVGE